MNYKIAIPSYKRTETLQNKTLKLLKKYNFSPKDIIIFVANKDEKIKYHNSINKNVKNQKNLYTIIVGKEGIKNIRNFMSKYFQENEKIFYIDDDISYIYEVKNKIDNDRKNNKLIEVKSLKNIINEAFNLCSKFNITNWGIYPVENPYFLKVKTKNNNHVSTDLKYIMGGFTGVINNHKCEVRSVDDKEDFERSIKYYLKDNGIIRLNNICCRTNCYKEKGGMQVERTKEKIHNSALKIFNKYPKLCTLNLKKKSGLTELRLKDKR